MVPAWSGSAAVPALASPSMAMGVRDRLACRCWASCVRPHSTWVKEALSGLAHAISSAGTLPATPVSREALLANLIGDAGRVQVASGCLDNRAGLSGCALVLTVPGRPGGHALGLRGLA